MAVSPTKTDAKKLLPILEPDWKDLDPDSLAELEGIALACMEKAFEIAQAKSKFVVVGQMYWTEADGFIKSFDPKAEKLSLGVFPTESQALKAADSLWGSPSTKETFRTWVLPIWHDTPAQWRKARKLALEAEETAARGGTSADRLSALVAAEEAAKPRCEGMAPDEDFDLQPCVRYPDHPGPCWPTIPSMETE